MYRAPSRRRGQLRRGVAKFGVAAGRRDDHPSGQNERKLAQFRFAARVCRATDRPTPPVQSNCRRRVQRLAMSVSRATARFRRSRRWRPQGQDIRILRLAQECAGAGFTSRTRASGPQPAFAEDGGADEAGLSTVPCGRRHRDAVAGTSVGSADDGGAALHQDGLKFIEREAVRKPGMASSLSSVPPVCRGRVR